MDIQLYEDIFENLKVHMEDKFGITVCHFAPFSPKYPIVIFKETRNQPENPRNGYLERVASLGYRIDVFAKDNGEKTKQKIAREIAFEANKYLSRVVGLNQLSWNEIEIETESDGILYHVLVTYSAYYFENKRMIL